MREHHEAALDAIVREATADETCVACILTGSVARGWERSDSDVDVVYVVTDREFERRRADWDLQLYRAVETVPDHPEVYLDGKVVNREFLAEVADHGSEPARAAFVGAEVRYADDPSIEPLLDRIPVYPEEERTDRIRTFYSQMQAYRWYVHEGEKRDDPYLRHHTAAQLALFGGRLLLAHNRVLFPYHKWFLRVLADAPEKPPDTIRLVRRLLDERTGEAADAFADAIEEFEDWNEPEAGWPVRFLLDREWQWRDGTPALEEL